MLRIEGLERVKWVLSFAKFFTEKVRFGPMGLVAATKNGPFPFPCGFHPSLPLPFRKKRIFCLIDKQHQTDSLKISRSKIIFSVLL